MLGAQSLMRESEVCLSEVAARSLPVVQVLNCSAPVTPIGAQSVALAAQATQSLTFDIFLTSNQAVASITCDVGITDSQVTPCAKPPSSRALLHI